MKSEKTFAAREKDGQRRREYRLADGLAQGELKARKGAKLRMCHALRRVTQSVIAAQPAAASKQTNGINGARIRMLLQ